MSVINLLGLLFHVVLQVLRYIKMATGIVIFSPKRTYMKHSTIYEKIIQQAMEMVGCSFTRIWQQLLLCHLLYLELSIKALGGTAQGSR